jgi:O-antigen/teichoic acid export membrane protein
VGIVFVATTVSNGLLFGVSLVAARALGPEDYGVVAAMLAMMVILTIPSFSLQVVVAREVAQAPDEGTVAAVLATRARQSLVAGVAGTVIACALAPLLRDWLNLPSVWPVVVTATVAVPLLLMTVLRGVLQGQHRYGALGASLVAEGLARFLAAVVAVAVGAGATGVTCAPTAGAILGGAMALWPLAATVRGARGLPRRPTVPGSVWATAAFFTGFAILTNTDVLIVKHAADATAAGEYAAAAFVGKIVLLLPIAVATVMIPEVAARQSRSAPTGRVLVQALALVGALCGLVAVACYAAPSAVAALTFGDGYPGAEDLLGPYAIAMLVMAAASVLGLYNLALGRWDVAAVCLALAPAQAAVMWLVRDDELQVIWTMAAAGAVLAAAGAWSAAGGGLRWRAWSPRARPRARS